MLKVTKADEIIEIKNICFTIYSQPGLGKTSLAFTSSKPLLLDFDKGSYRASNRKDVVQVDSWADVASISKDDLIDFDTIIIDTVGKALDFLALDIIAKNQKLSYSGTLNQQGWGQLGARFRAFLKLLNSFGKDVVLISHMDEKNDGDEIKERLKIQGGSKDLILTDSDVIARISIYNKERHLIFSPTESSFGKDPANLNDLTIPVATSAEFETNLANVIKKIKDKLNSLSKEQVERKSEVEWFKEVLPKIEKSSEINDILDRAKKGGRDISKMVVDRAAELGMDYDTETRGYVYPEETKFNDEQEGSSPFDEEPPEMGGSESLTNYE